MSDVFVLDASALLCLLQSEPGGERVAEVLPRSIIGAVNLSEVVAKLADAGGTLPQIGAAIDGLQLKVTPFDAQLAMIAGSLRPTTRSIGLSLGDRACLALGLTRNAVVLTCDRDWAKLKIDLAIEVLR